jgi:hypothetical protein
MSSTSQPATGSGTRTLRPRGATAPQRGRAAATRATVTSLLVVVILALGAGVAQAADDTAAAEPSGSARRLALGVSMEAYASLRKFQSFSRSAGRAPAIWSMWSDWGGRNSAFPDRGFLNALRNRGTVPMVFWQPVDPSDRDSDRYRYKRIIDGRFDRYIRSWARAARDFGGRVLVRFAHEMDGHWFPWGVSRFDNTPARFVKAWRHIWDIFKGVGATNVKFVWSPNHPCRGCSLYPRIYPGDRYVDYVAFTEFNWPPPAAWKSMVTRYRPYVRGLEDITRKPIIVAETGTTDQGGDKASWIRKGYPGVYDAYPRIKAIVYFNIDLRPGQPDWRLTRPAEAMDAYRSILSKTRFQGVIQ